jgi:hypothetical protein
LLSIDVRGEVCILGSARPQQAFDCPELLRLFEWANDRARWHGWQTMRQGFIGVRCMWTTAADGQNGRVICVGTGEYCRALYEPPCRGR